MIVEVPIFVLLARFRQGTEPCPTWRLALAGAVGTVITHPLLWFVWPLVIADYTVYIVSGEIIVATIESFTFYLIARPIRLNRAIAASFIANAVSYAVDGIASADLAFNPNYDGQADVNLLLGTDTLAVHDRRDPLTLDGAVISTRRAYKQAGVGPEDIDLFELHGAFGIMAALGLEAAGFAERGQGLRLALDGEIGDDLLLSTEPFWIRGLCFYDAGSRSFYTIDKPVHHPDDLKGIRESLPSLKELPETYTVSYRMGRRDGAYVWVESVNRVVRHPDTAWVEGIVSVTRDIRPDRK